MGCCVRGCTIESEAQLPAVTSPRREARGKGAEGTNTLAGAGPQVVLAVVALRAEAPAAPSCVGDCGGDGGVTVNELLTCVTIGLESTPPGSLRGLRCECRRRGHGR